MDGYTDDTTIADEEALWRRIPPGWIVSDSNQGGVRPSSQAFHDNADGSPMSVFLEKVMRQIGRVPDDALRGHEHFSLATITAGLARACKQGVAKDPEPDQPAHAVVFGKKTKKGVCRKLAEGSEWVIPPPDQIIK